MTNRPAASAPPFLSISKTFRFEAAHRFEHTPEDHPFHRLHGHSFEGTLTLGGAPDDSAGGFVVDFWEIEKTIKDVLSDFDHGFLNDIEDLPTPSLENIALTLARRFSVRLPGVMSVEIRRPSCGEAARIDVSAAP